MASDLCASAFPIPRPWTVHVGPSVSRGVENCLKLRGLEPYVDSTLGLLEEEREIEKAHDADFK